jgi:hypothetical protein
MQIHPMGLVRATNCVYLALIVAEAGSTNSGGYYEIEKVRPEITAVAVVYGRDGD